MSWEDHVRKVIPYVPGEQPKKKNIIKLNTNECPYPPAPGVRKILEQYDVEALRRYPDPQAFSLVDCLAEYYHLDPEQVFVGVGSDDVLAMAFLTFFNSDRPILFPDITYSFYDVWAQLFRIPYECQPLTEDFRICPDDYKKPNGGIIFPNPNAPTGVEEDISMIEDIIKANPDVVCIIDEAYVDFGGKSCLELINRYENLLIVQTFSKSRAMAGLRVGYAMGSKKLIRYLQDVKFSFNSYTMNSLTLAVGTEAIRDDAYFREITGKIIQTRERSKKELSELGFTFGDSKSNFIFASHKKIPAMEIFEALKEQDIYVRYWNKPRISNYLRISIGTDEEMDAMFAFLRKYMREREEK